LDVCVCAESFEWLIEWDMGRGDMMENWWVFGSFEI
jgi:hypothetical protein